MTRWSIENGRPIGGADEVKNISEKLYRARETFYNVRGTGVGGTGYWINDQPYVDNGGAHIGVYAGALTGHVGLEPQPGALSLETAALLTSSDKKR
jgi:hypothetical protein